MRTNQQVVDAFLRGEEAKNRSMCSIANGLFSYNTIIAERSREYGMIVNDTKYSVTTSKHQSLLRSVPADIHVSGVPRDTYSLKRYAENDYQKFYIEGDL